MGIVLASTSGCISNKDLERESAKAWANQVAARAMLDEANEKYSKAKASEEKALALDRQAKQTYASTRSLAEWIKERREEVYEREHLMTKMY
jgi:hypothetical protein